VTGLALPQWLQRRLATPRNPRQPGQTPSANFVMLSRPRSGVPGGAANRYFRASVHLKRMVFDHLLGESVSEPTPTVPIVVHWPFSVPSG
jgi:hypothetical protein